MNRAVSVAVLALVPLWSCGRGQSSAAPGEPGKADPGSVAPASTDAGAKLAPAPSAPTVPASWRGTYASSAGALYIPEELKVRWKAADTSSGLGDGPLSFTVDPARGVVEGTIGGPLGPAKVNGYVADGGLSASVVRSDPRDHGYTGVLLGNVANDRVTGTFNVSPATGGAVRAGTFTMTAAGGDADR
jgi:hypothetical protein